MDRLVKGTVAFVLLSAFLLPWSVSAEELPVFYKGLRPLGMGGGPSRPWRMTRMRCSTIRPG